MLVAFANKNINVIYARFRTLQIKLHNSAQKNNWLYFMNQKTSAKSVDILKQRRQKPKECKNIKKYQ